MHRLFLLRAYGDFVILLQALHQSAQKNKYTIIASKHLQPLYEVLELVIDLKSIQIQFVDFGITHTQLSLFTNKHLLSIDTLTELKQIKKFVKQNPNTQGIDYIEQDKRISLFNSITGLSFKAIVSKEPVYISYAKFFDIQDIKEVEVREESREDNNSKKVLLFPDTRQAKKNIPTSLISKLENELATKGYKLEIAYFKEALNSTIANNTATKTKQVVYSNFKTLIQLIQEAELILGADSLPIHLAYLLNKSHYILYPNGYPQLFITPYAQINNRFGTFDHHHFSFL